MADIPAPATNSLPSRSGGLAIAASIVAFGFLGSRLLGILRSIVIAKTFGSGPEIDAYVVAFRIPDLIFQVLAGATLGSAFIPVFARIVMREGDERAWQLASKVLNLVTVSTAVLALLAFIFAPVLVPLTAPDLVLPGKAIFLTRLMLLSPLLFAVSGMLTGILNGRQHFFLPALAPMLYNLAIIFGAIFLSGPFGIEGLAIGVVVGAGLHLLVQIPGLIHERMHYSPSLDTKDPAVREVGRLMGPRVIGLAATQFNFFVGIYFGSQLAKGTIGNLNYAWIIAQLPTALFGAALSTAVFPRLAGHVAGDDMESLYLTVSRVLRVIMFLTIPAAIGLAMLRHPATVLLLERGAFTHADAIVVASALGFYALGIVPQAGIEIHSRGFYALGDTRTPVTFAVGAVILNFILSALLWRPYGVEGLAFSVSASSWAEWTLLYFFYARRTQASITGDLTAIAKFAFCGAVMALFLAIAFAPFGTETRIQEAVIAIAGSAAGLVVYVAMANWLGIEELREATTRIRARFGR
ncbi:MAG: murein biosynthesis integral membrane protein MurJ [Tepidiformaceae bacterium]